MIDLNTIGKTIICAGKTLGEEKTFEISPIYLLPKMAGAEQYITNSLEKLIIDLEDSNVLFDQSDGIISISMEQNILNTSSGNDLGFYLQNAGFKTTLDQCVLYYNLKYHINQGIIVIDIKDCNDFIKDSILVENLLRHIQHHKKHFLIFIIFDEDGLKTIQNRIGKKVFTDTVVMPQLSLNDYLNWCDLQLQKYNVQLNKVGKDKLVNLLGKYIDQISYQVLEIWLQSVLWNYAISEKTYTALNSGFFSEKSLIEIIDKINSEKDKVQLGFSCSFNTSVPTRKNKSILS